jgi:cell division protein FtsB
LLEIHQLKSENKALKSENKAFKRQVSELSSGMNEALAMSEETEAENFALKQQLNLANERNQGSVASFGLNLFRS